MVLRSIPSPEGHSHSGRHPWTASACERRLGPDIAPFLLNLNPKHLIDYVLNKLWTCRKQLVYPGHPTLVSYSLFTPISKRDEPC